MFPRRSSRWGKVKEEKWLTWTTALLPAISSTWPFLTDPSPSLTFTISAYLMSNTMMLGIRHDKTLPPWGLWHLRAFRRRYLLGELDVVENDQGTLDIKYGSVVDARCNVVVGSDCLNVCLWLWLHADNLFCTVFFPFLGFWVVGDKISLWFIITRIRTLIY